ncbi:hypothetical protein [Streptomyces sp. NRRL B-24484]|uniref:hypothetical protein n=1 Tax=Streptomyces sp. NRRL B-24484 TaxID=1463833 RepID=UPI0013318486|nr:hypothetical protein [Streptomyces sp. NRRL B-24484]
MTECEGGDVFRWETHGAGNEPVADRGTYVGFTLLHLFVVGVVLLAEPLAGLLVGAALAAFWAVLLLPPRLRERRAVEWAEIRPGPDPELVLARVSGVEDVHPLDAVTRLRLVRTGYRSADHPDGGRQVLELRVGGTRYRTRAAHNPPENDPRLLAEALRRACPGVEVMADEDRTSWVSDSD